MPSHPDRTRRNYMSYSNDPNKMLNSNIKVHESGAKTSGNLPPYECLTEDFINRCAERMRLGIHYGKHNWEKGADNKDYVLERLRHAMAHLMKAMKEIDRDQTMNDDDLAAVAVNCMFAMKLHRANSLDDFCKLTVSAHHTSESQPQKMGER